MDEARREELAAFVDRRKAEGGVPTDFEVGPRGLRSGSKKPDRRRLPRMTTQTRPR